MSLEVQYTEQLEGFGKTQIDGTDRKLVTIRALAIRSKYGGSDTTVIMD